MHKYGWALLLCLISTPLLATPLSKNINLESLTQRQKEDSAQQDSLSNKNSKEMSFSIPDKHWGILIYHSWMTNSNIGPLLTAQNVHFKYGTMNSIDLSYQLDPANPLRRFFKPLVSTIEIAVISLKGMTLMG